MWKRVIWTGEAPSLRDPAMLVALSTSNPQYRSLYSHARELGNFMLSNLEFKRLATMYASALPPATIISDTGTARLVSVNLDLHMGKRNVILVTGDTSPVDEQYEFCEALLSLAKELGVVDLISIGTRWTEAVSSPDSTPKVLGFASDGEGVEDLASYGVTVIRDEPGPFFASMVVAMAKPYGIRGYKLSVDHGEPIPHPRSVIELIGVLSKMLRIEVDLAELRARATAMEAELQAEPATDMPPPARKGVYG